MPHLTLVIFVKSINLSLRLLLGDNKFEKDSYSFLSLIIHDATVVLQFIYSCTFTKAFVTPYLSIIYY